MYAGLGRVKAEAHQNRRLEMWQTVKREELYEQVWSVPIWTLCQQYGLSDNGLREVCKRLNVPVPPRGYWAKVEAGRKVQKITLPKDAEQSVAQIHVAPKPGRTEADDADDAWLAERVAFERAELECDRSRNEAAALASGGAASARILRAGSESGGGVAQGGRQRYQSWPEWRKQRDWNGDGMKWHWVVRNGELMPSTHHAFSLRLSLATYRRGLAIVNAVAVAATKRGFEVTHDDEKGRVVLVGHGGELELRMSEGTEQKTRKVKRYDGEFEDERYSVPTGRLRMFVERGYGKVWTIEETAEGPLETKLNALFAGVWKQVKFCRQKTRVEEAVARRQAVLAAEQRNPNESISREADSGAGTEASRGTHRGSGGVAAGGGNPGLCGGGASGGGVAGRGNPGERCVVDGVGASCCG